MNKSKLNTLKNKTHPDDILNFTEIKNYIKAGIPLNKDKINYIKNLDKSK
tara:strand:+ start:30609 stop:30758 length:150 start_codon:yes stop_codon:yes gene_type:complete